MYKISEVEIILLIVSNIRDNFLPNLHFCCYIQENMDLRKYSSISRYFLPFFRSSGLFRLASRATYTMLHSAKRTIHKRCLQAFHYTFAVDYMKQCSVELIATEIPFK